MKITLEDKISRAKGILLFKHPFFAVLALESPVEFVPWCKTMATDGKRIFAGEKFVEEHTEAELAGVIAHEVLHKALLHVYRIGMRDPKLANIAADYVVNPIIIDAGMTLPKDRLIDEKYFGLSFPEVYEMLLQNAKVVNVSFPSPPGDGEGDGNGGGEGENNEMWGGMVPPKGGDGKDASPAELNELEEEARISVSNAAEVAKSRGKLPASLEGFIEAIKKPKVDWKAYIQQWITGTRPDDFTWRKPNRKMLANHHVYMPTIRRSGAGVGLLSIDTSGSVSDSELQRYISEILGMIETVSPEKIIIVQHDAVIQKVDTIEPGDEFKGLKISGRGGTCIQPSFDYAEKLDEPIDWMICFTDMGIGDWPSYPPNFPVLWCATGPDVAPFGTYIDVRGN